jgi:predicted alpha/beta superfamily hydrolase
LLRLAVDATGAAAPHDFRSACEKGGGGTDAFLDFVVDTALPTALARLGFSLGEISISGFSLGGLTACYAAVQRPLVFRRALCMSPSVW